MNKDIDFMESLIRKNLELKNIFNIILILTLEIEFEDLEKMPDFFGDVYKRAAILEKFEKIFRNTKFLYLIKEYYFIEEEISEIIFKIKNKINSYEDDMLNMSKDILTEKEISSYIECLLSSLDNYDKKRFYEPYTIYFDKLSYNREDNFSKSAFIKEDKKITISIKRNQMFHLLGLPNVNNKNDILIQFFKDYCKRQGIVNLSEKNYLHFLREPNGLKKYLSIFLIKQKKLNKTEKEIYNKFTQTHKDIDKMLKKFLQKSFGKVINFRKVYEFKLIPEIIIDYQGEYVGEEKEDYIFRKYTMAFTPINKKNSILIKECDEEKLRNVLEQNDFELSAEAIDSFIEKLKQQNLLGYETLIEKNKKGEKTNRIRFRLENKYNCSFDGEQYNYDIIGKCLISDFSPNTMVLSYNRLDINEELCYFSIINAIMGACYLVAKEYKESGKKLKIVKDKFFSVDDEIFINNILKRLHSKKYNMNNYEVTKLEKLIHSSKNQKNVNDDFLGLLINFFMNNDIKIKYIFGEYDEDLINRLKKHIIPYLTSYVDMEIPIDYMKLNEFIKPATIIYNQFYDNSQKINSPVSSIGYVVKLGDMSKLKSDLDCEENVEVEEVYPKTFSGKTCVQLIYDLRLNGLNFFVNYIMAGSTPLNVGLVSQKKNVKKIARYIDIDDELNKYYFNFNSNSKKI